MKYNKILSISSSAVAILSLVTYSLFGYVECIQNIYIKDISLAVLGSALLLLVSSIVGYFIEKKHLQEEILSLTYEWNIATDIYYEIKDNGISLNSIVKLIDNSYRKLLLLHSKMRMYSRGLFKKDKELKNIICDLRPFAEYLTNFTVLLRHPNYNPQNISTEINTLLEKENALNERLSNWMKTSKFEMGEDFNINVPEENENV